MSKKKEAAPTAAKNTKKTKENKSETTKAKVEIEAAETVEAVEAESVEVEVEPVKAAEVKEEVPEAKPRTFDLNQEVACFNLTGSTLVYVDSRTHEKFEWGQYGDDVPLTIQNLITMRNTQVSFFKNQWIMISDEEVRKYLRVDKYYEGLPTLEELDTLLDEDEDKIAETISNLSESLKEMMALRAVEKVADGTLDSIKKIRVIESATGWSIQSE